MSVKGPAERLPLVAPRRGATVQALPFAGDDAALVQALREGHRGAAAAFFDRYAAHVRRVLVRVLGVEAELDDVHHDVFVRALGSIRSLREPEAMTAWITSVAIFTARTHIRKKRLRRWLRLMPPGELPEVPVSGPADEALLAMRSVYRLLDRLPVDERIAFTLRRFEQMELTEVARACGVSLATVKRRLSRAEATFAALAAEEPSLEAWLKGGAR